MSAPRAVLLDALGTLVALEPPAPALVGELHQRFGLNVSLADAERAFAAEIAFYRAHFDEGRDRMALARLRSRCAEVVRDALPAAAAVTLPAMTEALLASLRFTAFADAAPALRGLRAGRARLVVASNWDCSLPDILERVGLAPLLDGIVTSAQAGARKPAGAVFERALALAEVPAERATHVGDSVEDDVAGARAAGLDAVLIRRDGGQGPPGVRTIATLADLH